MDLRVWLEHSRPCEMHKSLSTARFGAVPGRCFARTFLFTVQYRVVIRLLYIIKYSQMVDAEFRNLKQSDRTGVVSLLEEVFQFGQFFLLLFDDFLLFRRIIRRLCSREKLDNELNIRKELKDH